MQVTYKASEQPWGTTTKSYHFLNRGLAAKEDNVELNRENLQKKKKTMK